MPLESSAPQRRTAVRQRVAVVPRLSQVVYSTVARRPLRLGVVDVSATGVHLRSQDELRTGDLLELAFKLNDEEVHVHGRVRRVVRHERVWDVGCAFERITEAQSDRIVKLIFEEQRAMLRARRGDR